MLFSILTKFGCICYEYNEYNDETNETHMDLLNLFKHNKHYLDTRNTAYPLIIEGNIRCDLLDTGLYSFIVLKQPVCLTKTQSYILGHGTQSILQNTCRPK